VFEATASADPAATLRAWADEFRDVRSTLFQTPPFLSTWYDTIGAQEGVQPLLVTVRRQGSGAVMGCPLALRERDGRREIVFADLGVTDYAAPWLAADCPADAEGALALWNALRSVLPAADHLVFEKMPATVNGQANPFALLSRARASRLFGNVVTIDGNFDDWRFTREKTHRKELERSWRVFTRNPSAEFRIVDTPALAEHVMAGLEDHQRRSIADKGWSYILDIPAYHAFYRRLLADGLSSGETVLSALLAGEEVVAALLGVRRGDTYAMIRIGNAMGEWRTCSPGRLIIERTMGALHAQGVRHFDFTIGDYYYKKGFQPDHVELLDLQMPLSWKGAIHVRVADAKHAAKAYVKARPGLEAFVRRALGRAAPASAKPAEPSADITPSENSPSA
jgi:CelD/BcsL family acetyltransferase involved in cellulose biosynthesis